MPICQPAIVMQPVENGSTLVLQSADGIQQRYVYPSAAALEHDFAVHVETLLNEFYLFQTALMKARSDLNGRAAP